MVWLVLFLGVECIISVQPLKTEEVYSPSEIKRRQLLDKLIESKVGSSINPPKEERASDDDKIFENYEDDQEEEIYVPEIEDAVDTNGKLIDQQPAYDKLINAEVMMQQGEDLVPCTVRQRTVEPYGKTMGTYDDDPYRNTIIYDVEFPDGQVKEYSSNLIADNIISQVDNDGFSKSLLKAIVD